ncbi:hypothetical protein JAAARDRAFT_203442 [Jaapia argillacea MUCL 33604]|uniref:Uncharacterized protein n=1 Tax=Jaapia argillacea MUCL 33604 TaxID=933084 RepID=A0A067Q7Y1_9AGAM|nr:hypothetical protein JAAARDRAFT_203442 [Jaapia argillacea MUCL 33604]
MSASRRAPPSHLPVPKSPLKFSLDAQRPHTRGSTPSPSRPALSDIKNTTTPSPYRPTPKPSRIAKPSPVSRAPIRSSPGNTQNRSPLTSRQPPSPSKPIPSPSPYSPQSGRLGNTMGNTISGRKLNSTPSRKTSVNGVSRIARRRDSVHTPKAPTPLRIVSPPSANLSALAAEAASPNSTPSDYEVMDRISSSFGESQTGDETDGVEEEDEDNCLFLSWVRSKLLCSTLPPAVHPKPLPTMQCTTVITPVVAEPPHAVLSSICARSNRASLNFAPAVDAISEDREREDESFMDYVFCSKSSLEWDSIMDSDSEPDSFPSKVLDTTLWDISSDEEEAVKSRFKHGPQSVQPFAPVSGRNTASSRSPSSRMSWTRLEVTRGQSSGMGTHRRSWRKSQDLILSLMSVADAVKNLATPSAPLKPKPFFASGSRRLTVSRPKNLKVSARGVGSTKGPAALVTSRRQGDWERVHQLTNQITSWFFLGYRRDSQVSNPNNPLVRAVPVVKQLEGYIRWAQSKTSGSRHEHG